MEQSWQCSIFYNFQIQSIILHPFFITSLVTSALPAALLFLSFFTSTTSTSVLLVLTQNNYPLSLTYNAIATLYISSKYSFHFSHHSFQLCHPSNFTFYPITNFYLATFHLTHFLLEHFYSHRLHDLSSI